MFKNDELWMKLVNWTLLITTAVLTVLTIAYVITIQMTEKVYHTQLLKCEVKNSLKAYWSEKQYLFDCGETQIKFEDKHSPEGYERFKANQKLEISYRTQYMITRDKPHFSELDFYSEDIRGPIKSSNGSMQRQLFDYVTIDEIKIKEIPQETLA